MLQITEGGTIRAYHFVGQTLRDGRPIPRDGECLRFTGEPILCKQGLHASQHPFDALRYAPGSTLCLVEIPSPDQMVGLQTDDGEYIYAGPATVMDDNKLCSIERTIIARIDATELLFYFARMQAVSVLDHWHECPPDIVLDYLMTGDQSIRAAAWASAESAAWSAAWSAAESAAARAWSAARASAESAARDLFLELVRESLG